MLSVAQEVSLFKEDFEVYPIPTFTMKSKDPIPQDLVGFGCSARIGIASDFNSTNVDFGSGNLTKFVGGNAISPCGGAIDPKFEYSENIDLTSATEKIKLRFKYFHTDPLDWNGGISPFLRIRFTSGGNSWTIVSGADFPAVNEEWTDVLVDFPLTFEGSISSIDIVTSIGGALGIDDFEIFYGVPNTSDLSKNQNTLVKSILTYPNPAKDVLFVDIEDPIKRISFFNIVGKKVLEYQNPTNSELDISVLKKGTYMLRIETNGETYERKIVKI